MRLAGTWDLILRTSYGTGPYNEGCLCPLSSQRLMCANQHLVQKQTLLYKIWGKASFINSRVYCSCDLLHCSVIYPIICLVISRTCNAHAMSKLVAVKQSCTLVVALHAGLNQPWFLGGKGLGIKQGTSVWVGLPKSSTTLVAVEIT